MINVSLDRLDTAFVRPGTPMFSDVMNRVAEDLGLSLERKRDILSGLRRVAKALGWTPENVPADSKWLQPRVEKILPASMNLSAKSWSNALSDARAGMAIMGLIKRRSSKATDLMPDWKRLLGIVLAMDDPTLQPTLGRLVYFLSGLGLHPNDVSENHTIAYRDALALNETSKSPEVAYRAAVNGWNLAVRRVPAWPRQTFTLPSGSKRIKLGPDILPKSFEEDLSKYVSGLKQPDPFYELAITAPLRPKTIRIYTASLFRFAAVLVHSGLPATEITDLGVLVKPENTRRGLRWMLAKTDNVTTRSISEMAGLLRNVAKRYVRVDDGAQKEIDRLNARLLLKPQLGMTAKNRARLRALEDKETLQRLLRLPGELFYRAKAHRQTHRAALAREDALAIVILLYSPVRRLNLSGIDLDRNFQRPGDGCVFLAFEPRAC